MWYSKRYIFLTVFLIFAVILQVHTLGKDSGEIESFRGASLEENFWNPYIADSWNSQVITLSIDGKNYTTKQYDLYMDEEMQLFAEIPFIRECLECSARVYGNQILFVEKYTSMMEFSLQEESYLLNGDTISSENTFVIKDGVYYASVNTIVEALGYSINYDAENNTVEIASEEETASILPSAYDLRARNRVATVKNQGSLDTCWAFAALSAMESALLPEEDLVFSEDHMTLSNSFSGNQTTGGDYNMAVAYLTAWQGPVLETDDPYGDGTSDDTLSAVKHVQEVQFIESKDLEKIKKAVFLYGGVQTSIYNALSGAKSSSVYYNSQEAAYCYIGTAKPNHDVVIVGWDDNYAKENFSEEPEGDGAFICQNSWGSSFGDNGYFYVSYYDTNIGIHNVVYTKIVDTDNYDSIYQTDLCGMVGKIGYGQSTAYGANVYTATENETLKAVGFYATAKDTSYKVYVVDTFESTESFDNMEKVAEGSFVSAGYYTVELDQDVELLAGNRFAVIIQITTPDSERPLAVEYQADSLTESVTIEDGEGYISVTGDTWEHVEEIEACNLCLKAYTVMTVEE